MFLSIGAQGKSGLITTERIDSSDNGILVEASGGGGDYGSTCDCDCENSSGPEVLAHLGEGGLCTGRE